MNVKTLISPQKYHNCDLNFVSFEEWWRPGGARLKLHLLLCGMYWYIFFSFWENTYPLFLVLSLCFLSISQRLKKKKKLPLPWSMFCCFGFALTIFILSKYTEHMSDTFAWFQIRWYVKLNVLTSANLCLIFWLQRMGNSQIEWNFHFAK